MSKVLRLVTCTLLVACATALAQNVAVLTPYLASATTRIMIDELTASLQTEGYAVNLIDTAGDVAALNSRMQDVVTQGVDAIVVSVNPELISAGLAEAAGAGIPVFGLDAGSTQGLVLDVTSNNYAMAAQTASYLVDRLNGRGRVIMLVHPPYAPVQRRGVVARAIFDNTPDLEVIDEIFVDVPGPLENARNAVEAILTANPEPGSVAGIWAAWDEPALGALQAVQALGREDEGIVIVGLDAIDSALEAVADGTPFEATAAQNFQVIAQTLAREVDAYLSGEKPAQATIYVPAELVTRSTVEP